MNVSLKITTVFIIISVIVCPHMAAVLSSPETVSVGYSSGTALKVLEVAT